MKKNFSEFFEIQEVENAFNLIGLLFLWKGYELEIQSLIGESS